MDTVKTKTAPKDFFLHLLVIIGLYISAGSFIALLFQYINLAFPDVLEGGYRARSAFQAIRWAVAALVVIFPTYVWASWFLNRGYAKNPEKRDVWIRKWLLYFTLFAAGLIIVGDLVAVIFNFLGGELTTRFILKVLAMLFVAGSVFGYYFVDLRKNKIKELKYFAYAIIAIVAAAVIASFFVVGSPAEERMRRFDARRISDLQSIQFSIVRFWQQKERLPSSLDELQDDISGFRASSDPENREPYEYRITHNLTFELCATFVRASDESRFFPEPPPKRTLSENWTHKAGRTCFERTIDPEFYPPFEGPRPVRF
ncbi:hypothetical protein IIA95_02290 [Patescibacteria group bacterium]|nr:hypothetical protein [Patescibacteria group bacterium]